MERTARGPPAGQSVICSCNLLDAIRFCNHTLLVPYDWTPAKNASNLAKHGVAFEALDGFDWATALVRGDIRNSHSEVRLNAYGLIGDRLHHLTCTIRRTTVWVISLRRANNKEAARYEADH